MYKQHYIILLLLLAASCQQPTASQENCDEIYVALKNAKSLMRSYPDSTLSILDSIWRDNERRLTSRERWAIHQKRCIISRYMLDFDAAEAYCLKSLEIATRMNNAFCQAASLIHLGAMEAKRGRQRNSIEFYQRAVELLDEENHRECITRLYLRIAGAFAEIEKIDSALYFLQVARTDDLRVQALVLARTAAIFLQIGDYLRAEEYYRNALPFFLQEDDKLNLINTYANISTALLKQNKIVEAMFYAQKSDDIAISIGMPTITLRAIYLHRGQQYYDEGDYQNSLRMLYLALERALIRQNEQLMAADFNQIGRLHTRLRNSDEAQYYTNKAFEIALQNDNIEMQVRALRNLASIHALRGDIEQFETTTAKKEALNDSLLTLQHNRTIQLLEMQYEAEQRELLLIKQAGDIRQQRITLYRVIVAGLVIITLLVYIYFLQRRKTQNQARIVQQYEAFLKYKQEAQTDKLSNTLNKLVSDLQHLFETEKIYRQQGLSVDDVVQKLHTNSKYLSNAISQKFHKNFAEYVNTYRVEEAIEMLKEQNKGGRYAHFTIQAIAEAVGFNCRTTFYTAFKRIVGLTPTEYMNVINQQQGVQKKQK